MAFRLNSEVGLCDFLRARTAEKSLVETLEKAGELLWIENIAVDVPNLIHRRFRCDTGHCVRIRRRGGRRRFSGSCCTDLVVEVTPPELRRLKTVARAYLRDVPNPPKRIAKVARKIVDDEILTETTKNEPCLEDCRTNRCILSYVDKKDVFRCAFHAMIVALGWPVEKWKLDACFAYPLHYVDIEPDRWFLTIVTPKNYKLLGAAKEAASMPCITKPLADAPPAYIALRAELEHLWGKRFWRDLDRRAKPVLAEKPKRKRR